MDFRGLNSAHAGMLRSREFSTLNVDFTTNPAEERAVADSVAQELDYLEKVVFSFDMERDPTTPSGNTGHTSKADENQSVGQARAASSTSTSSAREYFNQIDPQLLGALYASPTNRASQPQHSNTPPQAPQPGMPPFDPYMIAHAAALSALASAPQQAHPFPGQQGNLDPFAFLRAMYGQSLPAPPAAPLPPHLARTGPSTSANQSQPLLPQWLSQLSQPSASPVSSSSGQSSMRLASPIIAPSTSGSRLQRPEAGPSQPRERAQSLGSSQSTRAVSEEAHDLENLDETAIIEDKRRRNTAASGQSGPTFPTDALILLYIIRAQLASGSRRNINL